VRRPTPGRALLGFCADLARHYRPSRLANAALAEIGYRLRTADPLGGPTTLVVDLTTHCQLKCPLCPTGLGSPGRERQHIPVESFRAIVDRYRRTALRLFLTDWGEPLLHPRAAEMIAYAEDAGIWTAISTNGMHLPEALAEALVRARLSHATFSIDGATQESYQRYRVRGDISTVLANLERLVAVRNRLGATRPHVTWQYLVFQHNLHEVDAARARARELGVRFLERAGVLGGPGESPHQHGRSKERLDWLVDDPRWPEARGYFSDRPYLEDRHCWWLWKALVVSSSGSAPPCCCTFEEEHDLGDAFSVDPEVLRRSPRARRMRALFRRGPVPPGEPVVCERCDVFRRAHS